MFLFFLFYWEGFFYANKKNNKKMFFYCFLFRESGVSLLQFVNWCLKDALFFKIFRLVM